MPLPISIESLIAAVLKAPDEAILRNYLQDELQEELLWDRPTVNGIVRRFPRADWPRLMAADLYESEGDGERAAFVRQMVRGYHDLPMQSMWIVPRDRKKAKQWYKAINVLPSLARSFQFVEPGGFRVSYSTKYGFIVGAAVRGFVEHVSMSWDCCRYLLDAFAAADCCCLTTVYLTSRPLSFRAVPVGNVPHDMKCYFDGEVVTVGGSESSGLFRTPPLPDLLPLALSKRWPGITFSLEMSDDRP